MSDQTPRPGYGHRYARRFWKTAIVLAVISFIAPLLVGGTILDGVVNGIVGGLLWGALVNLLVAVPGSSRGTSR